MSTQPLRRIPASTASIAQASHQPNLLRNGRSEADIEAVYQEAQSLERRSMIEDAEKKFREALIGFESLYSVTHETTAAVAYHLASFYASCGRMKDADVVFDWMTGKYIQRYGHKGLETLEHLLNVVEMFCNWSRIKDSPKIVLLFQRIGLFYESDGIWNDAEPWFEQALLACYRSLGEGSSSAKRLEAALEKQRLSM
jgi:tetratricopeptide (TPR) repeat protein